MVHYGGMESTRVDRWLWAVRLTKTRPDAAAACRGGHVHVNDRPAKPATTVAPGDKIRARVGDTTRIVEVVRVIQKRVGASDAVTCYLDRTPAPPPTPYVPVAVRIAGPGGRPNGNVACWTSGARNSGRRGSENTADQAHCGSPPPSNPGRSIAAGSSSVGAGSSGTLCER